MFKPFRRKESSRSVVDYKIITDTNLCNLEKYVLRRISDGWHLFGGAGVSTKRVSNRTNYETMTLYAQTLVRYSDD